MSEKESNGMAQDSFVQSIFKYLHAMFVVSPVGGSGIPSQLNCFPKQVKNMQLMQ